jgi:hypothetical protein
MRAIFFIGKPAEKRRLGWEGSIKQVLQTDSWSVWIGFSWLRIGTDGGFL